MRYNTIRELDVANGDGIGVSIFIQGCNFNCPGCFNLVAKDFDGGKEFTEQTMETLIKLAKPDYINHLAVLGGEPLHPRNRQDTLDLVRKFKLVYPQKSIWLWTGYLWEEIADELIGSGVDIVVDGRFVEELKDLRLKHRGSSNQRVIDVNASTLNTVKLL
jgi:anaerobic ribonucleoside-triphosphate reductase activating protein